MTLKHSIFELEFYFLKPGKYNYVYAVENNFFSNYPDTLIQNCLCQVDLLLNKLNDKLYTLYFSLSGTLQMECGRCLNLSDYSFQADYQMEMKSDDDINSENDDIIILGPDQKSIDLSDYIYDMINLQYPLNYTCTMVKKECNPEMIKLINKFKTDKKVKEEIDPRWEKLKFLKNN